MSAKKSWHDESWKPSLAWDSPTGRLLQAAAEALASGLHGREIEIVVFGSGLLQMGVSTAIASGDVDIASDDDLAGIFSDAKLSKGQSSPYIELCPLGTFRTRPGWRERSHREQMRNVTIVFPHPIDILVSKIPRGEEKDFEAFEEVIKATGHPSEAELKDALMQAVSLYRPGYDESTAGDMQTNTRLLWRQLFGHDIDVRAEIIAPAANKG